MSNFKKILDHYALLSSESRGKEFERHCKLFLENDPRYKAQLQKVWLWNDWPDNWGRDKGIDLVAETHNGEIWAIQAKAYDESYYITKEDVDKFLSESSRKQISYRLLIATTDRIGSNALEVIRGQEKQTGTCLLYDLESSSLDWVELLSSTKKVTIKEPKKPLLHQLEAIKNVLSGFIKSHKGQLHMACGTGKTLVGLWVAKELKSQNTLVLVPSISLVSQLYIEWVENGADFLFDPIFVCSDISVSKKDDDLDQVLIQSSEIGFPVTTNVEEFLTKFRINSTRPKVVFSTYHSSPVIAQACKLNPDLVFDITIADEAHRCAGSAKSDFATIMHEHTIRTLRKLFMTATPKIFSNSVKQKTQEAAYEIVSMDDEHSFGPVFHKFVFSDAIAQGRLTDYQVLISVMDNATFKEYAQQGRFVTFDNNETDARTLASQLLVAKAIKKFDLKKIITFHSRKKSAQAFVKTFEPAMVLLSADDKPVLPYSETIFGEMQQSDRRKILKKFAELTNEEVGLIANVKCLSEGVDVPTLDAIVFIDPKGSEIDIVQCVGRAIRNAPGKKLGTIIIPIFVDIASDEIIDLEKSCFQVIWKVIKALRAHDDVLAEELDNIRLELGKRTYKNPPKLSKIIIDVPIGIGIEFSKSLQLKVIEMSASSWLYYFGLLESYKEVNGHTNVPSTYDQNPSLASWVVIQRVRYKKNILSQDRVNKLTSVGFIWDPIDSAWDEKFIKLCKFKEQKGHCNVPQVYLENRKFGNWVSVQRRRYIKNLLLQGQITKLEQLGFVWNPNIAAWEEMFAQLYKFIKEEGHCVVPKTYQENLKLGSWVAKQRTLFKNKKLSPECIERLEKVGFIWHSRIDRWQKNYKRLIELKRKTGHFNVLEEYPDDLKFDSWVRTQRKFYREGVLSQELIDALKVIGFTWDNLKVMAWKDMFKALCEYKDKKGNSSVPKTWLENQPLASWVSSQRKYYKDDKLPQERIKRLENIGFIWNPFDALWRDMFNQLSKYQALNGHCSIPAKFSENRPLGGWVARQREQYRKRKLSKDQIEMLESIGFVWDVRS